jgi:hypothetical protein
MTEEPVYIVWYCPAHGEQRLAQLASADMVPAKVRQDRLACGCLPCWLRFTAHNMAAAQSVLPQPIVFEPSLRSVEIAQ